MTPIPRLMILGACGDVMFYTSYRRVGWVKLAGRLELNAVRARNARCILGDEGPGRSSSYNMCLNLRAPCYSRADLGIRLEVSRRYARPSRTARIL